MIFIIAKSLIICVLKNVPIGIVKVNVIWATNMKMLFMTVNKNTNVTKSAHKVAVKINVI